MAAVLRPATLPPELWGSSTAALRSDCHRPTAATYRRRRLAAAGSVLVAAALVLSAVLGLLAPSEAGAGGAVPAAEVTYVVQPGDTLWSIAVELAPGTDPRPVVDALAAANGGAALVPGQRLVVDLGR